MSRRQYLRRINGNAFCNVIYVIYSKLYVYKTHLLCYVTEIQHSLIVKDLKYETAVTRCIHIKQ